MTLSQIKVLHLIGGELTGGAARGAYALHKGLEKRGVHSRVLTDSNNTLSDPSVISVAKDGSGKFKRLLRQQLDSFFLRFYRKRKKNIFSVGLSGYDFRKTDAYKEATVLHLHWVNNGFLNINHLRNVNKPIIWTLRDMWPLTGGCHYSLDCNQYSSGCGSCPQLGSKFKFDLSWFVSKRKSKLLPRSIKIVGISHWISELAKESSLFNGFDIRTISNCIDTDEFLPINKSVARSILGISTDKKIVLVGATSVDDFYKGFDKFLNSLLHLDKNQFHLCFFGNIDQSKLSEIEFTYTSFGFLNDTYSLRLVYSAADVFVAPSTMEAFGKTQVEALSCGTPVVCFDATGPKDIVQHQVNGYRAKPFDSEDLAIGVRWVCSNVNPFDLVEVSNIKIPSLFGNLAIADQYIQLYKDLMEDSRYTNRHLED